MIYAVASIISAVIQNNFYSDVIKLHKTYNTMQLSIYIVL